MHPNRKDIPAPVPDSQPWARFDDVVDHLVGRPLTRIQEQVASVTTTLSGRIDELAGALTDVPDTLDELKKCLKQVTKRLEDLQAHADATAADEEDRRRYREVITRNLTALNEAANDVPSRLDAGAEILGTRLDLAANAAKKELGHAETRLVGQIRQTHVALRAEQTQDLTTRATAFADMLRTLHAEAKTTHERATKGLNTAILDLHNKLERELTAASRRSHQTDEAHARQFEQLRWTSYAILVMLIIVTGSLLVAALVR